MNNEGVLVHSHLKNQYNVKFYEVMAPLGGQIHHKSHTTASGKQVEQLLRVADALSRYKQTSLNIFKATNECKLSHATMISFYTSYSFGRDLLN